MKREHEPEVVTCTVCDGTGVVLESVVKAVLESVSLQQEWCRLVDAIYGAGPIPVGVNITVGMAVERADQLHADVTKLRECIGLFSTAGPGDMEMDVENPISMAYQTVAYVARLKERNEKLEAVLEAAQDVGDDWNGEPQVLTLGDTDVMCAVVSYDPMNMLQNALAAVRDE